MVHVYSDPWNSAEQNSKVWPRTKADADAEFKLDFATNGTLAKFGYQEIPEVAEGKDPLDLLQHEHDAFGRTNVEVISGARTPHYKRNVEADPLAERNTYNAAHQAGFVMNVTIAIENIEQLKG